MDLRARHFAFIRNSGTTTMFRGENEGTMHLTDKCDFHDLISHQVTSVNVCICVSITINPEPFLNNPNHTTVISVRSLLLYSIKVGHLYLFRS